MMDNHSDFRAYTSLDLALHTIWLSARTGSPLDLALRPTWLSARFSSPHDQFSLAPALRSIQHSARLVAT
jgi:hypothetical protein